MLWEELFEDDEPRGRDESFSSTTSDDYASPAAPATPSQSHGLFGSYSFFANSPQPQAQLPPTHRRGKSTPNSSPFLDGTRLSRIPSRRASDTDDGGFGAAIVVGRVEFDFEMRGDEEERGTPVEQAPQFEPMGFPQVERRRSSGASSSDGGKKVQRDWAKRRGSTKPVMRSEAEQNEILTPAVEAPPMPSPPRWSPAVSRGLFSPPEPRRGGSSSRASPGASRATLRSPPTSSTTLLPHLSSALSPITDSPNASSIGDSGVHTPLGGGKENASPSLSSLASSFGERRPSVSVNLASFLGNVKMEMEEIEKLADSPPAKEQEVGLGVFSVAEVEEEDTPDRPVSSAGSALELVDTLDALQQALGFEHERRPSHATTDTTISEAETTSTNRSPVPRSHMGHNRSHSSPQPPSTSLFAIQEFPEAAPSRTARIPRKNAPRVDAVAGEGFTSDPHRWSTVSPRNSAYGLTPSRPAPAPPLPSQVAPVTTPRASTPPQPASVSHTPLLGRFSLDHGRPKLSDLAASAEGTPKATPPSTPSMWSAFPKFGGLFGGGNKARTDEGTSEAPSGLAFVLQRADHPSAHPGSPEVLAAASPIPSSSDSPSLENVPMPGKTPHRRSNSLSKRFANIRSNHTTPPDAPPLPSTTTTTNSHTSNRSGGRHSPASSRSSSTASASSVMLSANAIQAVTNSAVPSRRGSNTSALGYETKPQHRAVGSIGSLRGDVGAGRPRFEVDLRSAQEAEPRRKELSKDVLRAMI